MKHIKQLKFVLAGIVAFTTVLTLIRPAITFENTICGLEEHTHTEECYQTIQNTVPHKTLNCTEESLHIHVHSPNCYDENNNIICGYADYMIHEHNEDCYDENNQLICTLPEIKEHTHDSNCYDSENNLICDKQEFIEHTHDNNCYDPEGNLICGLPELKKHIHDDSCFTQTEEIIEDEQLICDKPEHIHTEECYETEEDIEYVCGKEEHTHDTSCYNEDNELICGKEEHVHGSECLENKELTYQGEDYIVTVQYGSDANLPDGVELIVNEIDEESEEYKTYFEQAKNSIEESKKITFARLLDIEFQFNGEKIEPSSDVSVLITYLDTSLNENIQYQTIHFKEDGNEIIDTQSIQNEDGSASFFHFQNGFSPVMTLGTEDDNTTTDTSVQENNRVTGITNQTHKITYKVYQDGQWITVKEEETYNSGTITGNNCALISSTKAAEVYGSYGYSATENPSGHFGYSYDDLYNIEYSDISGQGQNCFMSVDGIGSGNKVQLSTTNNNDYQLFRLLAGTDGTKLISPYGTNGKTNLYVNLTGNSGTDGKKLQLYNVGAGDHASEWKILDGGNGTVRFEARDHEKYFIDLPGGTITNGSQLQVWHDGGATYWKLNKVEKIINSNVFAQNEDDTYTIGLTPDSTGDIVCYYWPSSEKTINIEAINTLDENANAILVNLYTKSTGPYNLGTYFNKTSKELSGYYAIRIEKHNNVYKVMQVGKANHDFGVLVKDSYIVLIKNGVKNQYFIPSVGDSVDVEFLNGADKSNEYRYKGTIYAKLDFSVSSQTKDPKNNSSKLTIVPGANTRDLIEVNLYDYGENINENYNSEKKYPGFQQNEGTFFYEKDSTSSLGQYKFNLGDNITSDLNAGNTEITNKGGTINSTNDANNGSINRPITGAMKNTLGTDGYPALSDGTSLSYLFNNNTYAAKKNSQSINGLFQYNETTGAYTFNSRENHAQFNASNDTFTLYNQIISSNAMMYPFGNFLPFNDIVQESAQSSTIDRDYLISIMNSAKQKGEMNLGGLTKYQTSGIGTRNRYANLAEQMQKFIDRMDAQTGNEHWKMEDLTKSYFYKSNIPNDVITNELLSKIYTIDFDEPTDFYFGMEMKMNFMQPKNGLTGKDGQQPMVFYFTGDDDVWVYIDGKLVLDLSGIHRHVGGEIDFVNGEVKYYELSKDTGDVGTIPYKTVSFNDLGLETNSKGTLNDYSTHSFNFYYMERGAGSGVCRMNFNFPLLKKNSISVSKELSVDDESAQNILGNPNFKFLKYTPFQGQIICGKSHLV
ncbi:MAG: RICIN domain-containing protein, partial [Erysipelotrichaceae bacterium]|nr:RICIN domain-containing protein [Erysipelotrichaceae bacterium]